MRTMTLFLDGVDWQHELGEAGDGTTLYPSLQGLKVGNSCWESCGVVKVTARFLNEEWVVPQDLMKGSKSAKEIEEEDPQQQARERIAGYEMHLKRLDERKAWLQSRITAARHEAGL